MVLITEKQIKNACNDYNIVGDDGRELSQEYRMRKVLENFVAATPAPAAPSQHDAWTCACDECKRKFGFAPAAPQEADMEKPLKPAAHGDGNKKPSGPPNKPMSHGAYERAIKQRR